MRVNIVCGADLCNDKIVKKTYTLLTDELSQVRAMVLTEEHPDLVHIIGAWNAATIAIAKQLVKRHIPFIYTPLGSLSPWHKPTASFMRWAATAQTIVASGVMEQKLLSKQGTDRLQLVLNAVTTKTTTPSDMAYAYAAIYERTISSSNISLWEMIDTQIKMLNEDDETIVGLCRTLLYAHYLYERRSIPQNFLINLSGMMTTADYDEDHFAEVIRLINLYDFTRRLEHVMYEKTGLTEGFMPIPKSNDNEAKEMIRTVTDYEE